MLFFLFLQLAFQVRMTDHKIFTIPIYLEIGVILDCKTTIFYDLLVFNCLWNLDIDKILNLLFSPFQDVGIFKLILKSIVQFQMHQISMHILFEHFGVHQILATKLVNLLFADKLILIIDYFTVLLLKLLRYVLDIWHPFWAWTKLWNEIATNFGLLKSCKEQTTGINHSKHVDPIIRLNTCEKFTISISDLYLFLVAEKDIL